MLRIHENELKNVRIKKLDSFKGYQIFFNIEHQTFYFDIGYGETFFPLNIQHYFHNQEKCLACNRTIFPVPIGQQPCLVLRKEMKNLLRLLLDQYPESFKLE